MLKRTINQRSYNPFPPPDLLPLLIGCELFWVPVSEPLLAELNFGGLHCVNFCLD